MIVEVICRIVENLFLVEIKKEISFRLIHPPTNISFLYL